MIECASLIIFNNKTVHFEHQYALNAHNNIVSMDFNLKKKHFLLCQLYRFHSFLPSCCCRFYNNGKTYHISTICVCNTKNISFCKIYLCISIFDLPVIATIFQFNVNILQYIVIS